MAITKQRTQRLASRVSLDSMKRSFVFGDYSSQPFHSWHNFAPFWRIHLEAGPSVCLHTLITCSSAFMWLYNSSTCIRVLSVSSIFCLFYTPASLKLHLNIKANCHQTAEEELKPPECEETLAIFRKGGPSSRGKGAAALTHEPPVHVRVTQTENV